MTKQELSTALEIARSDTDLSGVDTSIFDGCALPGFTPITVTLDALAAFVRYHVICLNGSIDAHELDNIASYGRRVFRVV